MRLTVDLDSLQLITSAGDRRRVSMVEFKRGDSTPLEVQFVRSGVAEALAGGAVLSFGLKESDKYDGDFAVFFDEFAAPTATPNFIYAGTPSLNTVELDDLLLKDGNSANDVPYIDLMGELSWSDDSNPATIRTFVARVHNDVIRGDEATPTAQPTPIAWLGERVMTRTTAQGAPSEIPDVLVVTGITDPSGRDPEVLTRGAVNVNGYPAWASAFGAIEWNSGVWYIQLTPDYQATKTHAAMSPAGLTGWLVVDGMGPPTVTGDPIIGEFLGQFCRVGDATPYDWYQWDGTAWILRFS